MAFFFPEDLDPSRKDARLMLRPNDGHSATDVITKQHLQSCLRDCILASTHRGPGLHMVKWRWPNNVLRGAVNLQRQDCHSSDVFRAAPPVSPPVVLSDVYVYPKVTQFCAPVCHVLFLRQFFRKSTNAVSPLSFCALTPFLCRMCGRNIIVESSVFLSSV